MKVKKRDGSIEEFQYEKIEKAVNSAFKSCNIIFDYKGRKALNEYINILYSKDIIYDVNNIEDSVENFLMASYPDVAKSYIVYRNEHKNARFIKERLEYIKQYKYNTEMGGNASTISETDSNANVTVPNVSTLVGEVYKTTNRLIIRQFIKEQLYKDFPEVAKQYSKDLDNHIIYAHDESNYPIPFQYCMAVSLYPLMLNGVGNIDNVTPSAPNDLQSFSGQITNLIFLLSSQCKGAVAVSEYFIALNYYVVKEFGEDWYNKLNRNTTSSVSVNKRTVKNCIHKAFKQFIYGINQPAGNRGFQSPFTNISYFDSNYFNSLFEDFVYPDGSKPEWKAIDTLQRLFIKFFNNLRTKQILTFPVESFCMVHDGKDIIDKDYKKLCAKMYSEGHSFFTYISDSVDSLASCCRLKSNLQNNTFSPTTGLNGVMTGSCNVITLNMNRILQDFFREKIEYDDVEKFQHDSKKWYELNKDLFKIKFREYLTNILERVYKYHKSYRNLLYDFEDSKMYASSNANYIRINKLYSTIGINGMNECCMFLGLEISNNNEYLEFLQYFLTIIKEEDSKNSEVDIKYPCIFNSEFVPKRSGYFKPLVIDLEILIG